MKANDHQVGGNHYRKHNSEIQHWDYAELKHFDKWQYQITKYVERWKDKNGILDLQKARHFLDKYIEVEKAKLENKAKDADQVQLGLNLGTQIVDNAIASAAARLNLSYKAQDQQFPFGFDASTDSK